MKKFTLIGLLIGALAVGVLLGGYIGARLTGQALGSLAYSKPEVDLAANAAQIAEWLAQLRLGDTNGAICNMENSLNLQVQTLASWDLVVWSDEPTRQIRNRWLVPVKVYRQSYPASGNDLLHANRLLATIPGRNPSNTCQSSICQLDDLRLARLAAATNSP